MAQLRRSGDSIPAGLDPDLAALWPAKAAGERSMLEMLQVARDINREQPAAGLSSARRERLSVEEGADDV